MKLSMAPFAYYIWNIWILNIGAHHNTCTFKISSETTCRGELPVIEKLLSSEWKNWANIDLLSAIQKLMRYKLMQ